MLFLILKLLINKKKKKKKYPRKKPIKFNQGIRNKQIAHSNSSSTLISDASFIKAGIEAKRIIDRNKNKID